MMEKNRNSWVDIKAEDLLATKLRVKIINILARCKEINISGLVKKARSNHAEVMKQVEYFKKIGLVDEKYYGRIHIIRIKSNKLLGKILIDFFKMFKEP
ncbi:hypothetical protein GF325_00865 [Candidatus Bathyarchaeota archaeon]|nr:hypothetical protein [Candidatus Bathyarchaeota archaeon]